MKAHFIQKHGLVYYEKLKIENSICFNRGNLFSFYLYPQTNIKRDQNVHTRIFT